MNLELAVTIGSDEAFQRRDISKGVNYKEDSLILRVRSVALTLPRHLFFGTLFLGVIIALLPGIIIHEGSHILGAFAAHLNAEYRNKVNVGWIYRSAPIGNLAAFIGLTVLSMTLTGFAENTALYVAATSYLCLLCSGHDWFYEQTESYTEEDLNEAREKLEDRLE